MASLTNSSNPDFKTLFEFTPSCSIVILPDFPHFTITAVTNSYLEQMQMSRHEMVGKKFFEVHEASADELKLSLERVVQHKLVDSIYVPMKNECTGKPNSSSWRHVSTPLLGPTGDLLCILLHLENVASSWNNLAQDKFRSLLNSSQDAILTVGQDGKINFCNHQASQWFGYRCEELIGQEIEVLVPERFRKMHVKQRSDYFTHPVPRPMGRGFLLKARRKDGTEFFADIALTPLELSDGLIVTATIRDMTETQEREQKMQTLYEEAQHAIKNREDVLAIVSHDLKNPLTSIQLIGELLAKLKIKDQQKLLMFSEKIKFSAVQMQRLISDLLDFSKIQSGKLSIEKKPVNTVEILALVFDIMNVQAKEKGIELSLGIGEATTSVPCDQQRMIQAILNLVGNAIKFTEPGGQIHLSVSENSHEVKFSVSDTGSGISKEDLQNVFDRYWQGEEARKFGAGLGLSISKGIIEAHGGKIWLESQIGKGTTFFISLPRNHLLSDIESAHVH